MNARVRWLSGSLAEGAPITQAGPYAVLDAVEWAVGLTQPFRDQSQRLRQLHRNLRGVYPQFGVKGENNTGLVAL